MPSIRAAALLTAAALPILAALPVQATPPGPPVTSTRNRALAPDTRFYVVPMEDGERQIIKTLLQERRYADAARIAQMASVPMSAWFGSETPEQVRQNARAHLAKADAQGAVAVMSVYDIPFRDCSSYSAGGAKDAAAYRAWIDALASAIGRHKAVILLETDALGKIPWITTWYGEEEGCRPTGEDGKPAPEADPETRFALFNYAVDRFEALPNVSVYLDGTHSRWLDVAEVTIRLDKAGVRKAQGFFLNVSGYQPTDENVIYGTWVSQCLAAVQLGTDAIRGHPELCPTQYNPDKDYALDYSPEYVAQVNAQMKALLGDAKPTAHFVIDTSRNGRGVPSPDRFAAPPYNQPAGVISALSAGSWCNPAGAGTGLRPTARTGLPLVDAFVWVKIPGQSDGSCDIAGGVRAWDFDAYNPWDVTGDAQRNFDPEWGVIDPVAGGWFLRQAVDLTRNANPPFWP
jgi:endoglucanase